MPAPTSNQNTSNVHSGRRHPEYFFQEADVTFKAEDTVFRVHRRFFFRESQYFKKLFTSPNIPCNDPPGSSETNPVVLEGVTSDAFACLLWVFYNPKYSIYTNTVENWVQILALAQKWGFIEVESLCIRELEKLPIPAVEKIQIYQKFKIDRILLLEAFAKLTMRPEPLDLDEAQKIGLETTIQIARARELSRGSRAGSRPGAIQLQDPELRSAIRDVFGIDSEDVFELLNGPAPTGPPTSQQQQPAANDNNRRRRDQPR